MQRLAILFPLAVFAVAAPAPRPDQPAPMLVTPAWLAEHLHDKHLVLLHVAMLHMGTSDDYAHRHIPGARILDFMTVLGHGSPEGLSLEMPPAESLRVRLEQLGISDDSRIVLYYASRDFSITTRVYFTLYYAGLGESTSVLDGGMAAWIRAGHPTTDAVPAAHAGRLAPLQIRPIVVDAEWVRAHAQAPGYDLVDARAAGFYDGVMEGGPRDARRHGHIPGARSVPFTQVVDDSNGFKSAADLSALFRDAGVKTGDTIVGYCHIGQQATAMLFAARSIGFPVRLYDGSFEDWARRNWPVEAEGAKAP